ncbi:copper-translocating P-type ATPase [Desulfosarcina ovata subsp. sediminis]|uniref:P-type Zn(2+) transporter n=1 Tax=Desulfosarcina ovata subsp. sediminis TaxID=885957 RepID=A0A5K7ZV58_9BACT|nr:cation-translocating P-type ATPase [Desulfosarcina ovata]BBO84051.1 copper-translocating P-type ATPase [Desulfosarcina ovata subsp. sediminis]
MRKIDRPIIIRHTISGRARYCLPRLRRHRGMAAPLSEMLNTTEGVLRARVNPKCNAVIVRFDPQTLTQQALTRMLEDFWRTRVPSVVSTAKQVPARSDDSRRSELTTTKRRFIGLSILGAGVFVRTVLLGLPVAQTLLSPLGAIIALAALPLVRSGLSDLRERRISLESFLGGSIIAAVAAGEALAAFEILWITSAGNLLKAWITERSRRAIRDILDVTEKDTYILVDGVEVSVAVDRVQPGDTVVLHTGEKIAVDGRVVRGGALVDEASITGMSEPVAKTDGDTVFAGTFVRQGVIYVCAEAVGDRTYLSRILRMVEDSLETRAPIEGVADRLARNLVKTGFAVTLATLVITGSLWRAFAVMLVMACPCATILAASTAISAAISAAARRHILIKGGRYLEEVDKVDTICFDKTGTLTTNQPEIRQLINLNGLSEDQLIELAYSTEIHNSHPVALAIREEARRRGITAIQHDVCEYILGKGVRSVIHGDEVLVGSHKLLEHFEITHPVVDDFLEKNKQQGLTQVFLARNGEVLGVIGFANRERPDLQPLIARLKERGIRRTAMITGDSKYTALEMACRLNFDECRYSVLPEEKAVIVAALKAEGHRVLMVGDGINDALALAEADIGVAMGAGGSEVAIEAADIALVMDDLDGVIYVRDLSRETMRVVHQNFWIATGSNIAGVVLGALGLLSPVMAGLVHITHTLGILANSGRLLFYEPPRRLPADTKHKPINQTRAANEAGTYAGITALHSGGAPHPGTDSPSLRHENCQ